MDKQATSNMERSDNGRGTERGFTLLQLLMVVTIVGIVTTYALISLATSRDNIHLQNSVRQIAGYIEKARLDAIRRHATASLTFTSTTTYNVTMDFDGTGNVGTRSFSLENGIAVSSLGLPSVSFNWRGRTLACTVIFTLQNVGGLQSWVSVSDAGDVTVNNDVDVLPTVSYSNVSSTGDVVSGIVVSGTGVHNNGVDCSSSGGGSGTDTTPITGTGTSGCKLSATPSLLSVKKNGGSTGSVTVSYTGTGAATVTPSGPINLQVTPTSSTIASGGSANFSIKSVNTTRSTFGVNFASSCTTITVAVKVTN